MAFVPAALGWSQYYVQSATWGPGSWDNSGYNTNLAFNDISFDNRYGGNPYLGTTYINGSGSMYSWDWWLSGYHEDPRLGYSYGAAECKASGQNNYSLYVNYCWTSQ